MEPKVVQSSSSALGVVGSATDRLLAWCSHWRGDRLGELLVFPRLRFYGLKPDIRLGRPEAARHRQEPPDQRPCQGTPPIVCALNHAHRIEFQPHTSRTGAWPAIPVRPPPRPHSGEFADVHHLLLLRIHTIIIPKSASADLPGSGVTTICKTLLLI